MAAAEASRRFSDFLSRVARGDPVEVDRHGEIVAVVGPVRRSLVRGSDVLKALTKLPGPDKDFARDVSGISKAVIPSSDRWRS